MSPEVQLWLCVGVIYMFAFSDRSYLKSAKSGSEHFAGFVVELIWAFILVSPAFVGAVGALRELLKQA